MRRNSGFYVWDASRCIKLATRFYTSIGRQRVHPHQIMHLHYAPRGTDIDLIVNGDDFVTVGDAQELHWLRGILESKFEISTVVVGHEPGDTRMAKVRNRVISAVERGFTYEADARHAELIVRRLGRQDARAVSERTGKRQYLWRR